MRILILSDVNSIHTYRWVSALSQKGVEIALFGLTGPEKYSYSDLVSVTIFSIDLRRNIYKSKEGGFKKIKYIKAVPEVKKIIKSFRPDIVHAHYASSYGLIGVLAGFSPLIISVWGSDVYDFPKKSFFHKWIIKHNLKKADYVLSTSKVMAAEASKYCKKNIQVTPFGIDTKKFLKKIVKSIFDDEYIVIGTIKTLHPKYGIDNLIKVFRILKDRFPIQKLKLLIVGEGPQKEELMQLVRNSGLEECVYFTGYIAHDMTVLYYNMIDIYVALSTMDSESFGVAILEASACELPVVVSDVGGLPEVVENGKTGYIVSGKNIIQAVDMIQCLIENKVKRLEMGVSGRKRVLELYEWNASVNIMFSIYNNVFKSCEPNC